ncbi:hypothetical protein Runsl_4041 [Runella slithyformis DSM 19594]|uniref:Uncharacterized protein n=1 Tax=Runella slithyformis (strain ATCC 29530 / DSM 19594 / LMG 11500 / NCIMB 11436 / LSU 4) TaxID=761193 RepID=A0A7U3ZNC3_RUNSL|nr:hypothetical protein Runsl_4041 [Runella slithyformis DSM 19594]
MQSVGIKIRKLRELQDLTQGDMASQLSSRQAKEKRCGTPHGAFSFFRNTFDSLLYLLGLKINLFIIEFYYFLQSSIGRAVKEFGCYCSPDRNTCRRPVDCRFCAKLIFNGKCKAYYCNG